MLVDKTYNNHRSRRLDQVLTDFFAVAFGGALVYASVVYLIPTDIFTTAAWIDGMGFNYVIEGNANFDFLVYWLGAEHLSFGAVIFAAVLWLSILYFVYAFQTAGSWSKECTNMGQLLSAKYHSLITQKPLRLTDFNHEKAFYFIIAISLTMVDVATDAAWKSNTQVYGWSHFFGAAVYSFVVYNMASEWFIASVGKEVVQRIIHLLYGVVALISPDIAYQVKKLTHSSINVNEPTDGYKPTSKPKKSGGGFLNNLTGKKGKGKSKNSDNPPPVSPRIGSSSSSGRGVRPPSFDRMLD